MKPQILKASVKDEFMTVERCHITEVANDDDDIELSVAIARVEPGITTAWHKLDDINERYLVISGEGRVELGESDPLEVGPGDVARIPAGTPQRITNTGRTDLFFHHSLYQATKNLRRQKKTKTDPRNTGKHINILRR